MRIGATSSNLVASVLLLTIVFATTSCNPIARPAPTRAPDPTATPAPATARASQLPLEGQLIIPKGYRFSIPEGMVGTTWYFPSFDEAENIIKFSAGVASDRAAKYGGRPEDYLTVIWTGERLTEGEDSACPDRFYSEPGVGAPGTVIGSKNCIRMLEYRLAQ